MGGGDSEVKTSTKMAYFFFGFMQPNNFFVVKLLLTVFLPENIIQEDIKKEYRFEDRQKMYLFTNKIPFQDYIFGKQDRLELWKKKLNE